MKGLVPAWSSARVCEQVGKRDTVEKKFRTTMWRDQESYQEGNSNILEEIKDSPETEQEWQYNNLLYFHASKHKDKAEEV